MISVDITIDDDILKAIRTAPYPRLMQTAYRRNIQRLSSRVLSQLRQTPGSPKRPIRWKSKRQQRAFFASNGFGRGIPTTRSNRMVDGWQAEFDGDTYRIYNGVSYTRYVVGDDQQPFHMDTGWYSAGAILSDARVEAEDIAIETWFTVVDGVVNS